MEEFGINKSESILITGTPCMSSSNFVWEIINNVKYIEDSGFVLAEFGDTS